MKHHITLRKPTFSDYAKMASLIQDEQEHLWAFPSASFPLSVDDIQKRAESREFTIVLEDDKLIGFANLYEEKSHLFIGNFVISAEYRKKGHGKNLMIFLLDKARKVYGTKTIMISVILGNDIAKKLYEQIGFVQSSTEFFETYIGKKYMVLHMKKAL